MSDLPYAGPERRRVVPIDDAKLDAALEEVRKLHGKTTELAEAVSRTVPRQEVEARERQFRWLVGIIVAATFIAMLLVPVMTRVGLAARFEGIRNGQRTTQCLLTKSEAERTGSLADTAVLTCSQKASR